MMLEQTRFEPGVSAGEVIPYEGEVLRLEEATLELWERDQDSHSFHRGAPRLLATLQEGS